MTTVGTWYPPSCGTGGFLIELTNPPFTMTDHTEQTTTPKLPPEVFAELLAEALRATTNWTIELARLAYAAEADAELEACCEWLEEDPYESPTRGQVAGRLRAARRPKPMSLKEQALQALEELTQNGISNAHLAAIRRALESLPDPQ